MSGPPKVASEAKDRPKKRWFAYFGANSLAISILIHVLFGIGATYLIVEHFQKKHINFHATEPPSQHTQVEHKVELAKRNNVESAPPDLKRIVSTDVSAITLPEPPATPNDDATPAAMDGIDGVLGTGIGSGNGPGGNGSGMPSFPSFGVVDGTGLSGRLIDLKQTRDKTPTGIEHAKFYKMLEQYVSAGWHDSMFENYYWSHTALHADAFEIPSISSQNAPKAFQVEQEVKPSWWIAHYHGIVEAPQSGEYRFAGYADNVIVVRIGGKDVLDGGINLISTDAKLHEHLPYVVSTSKFKNLDGYLKIGPAFHMEAATPVNMDVLIGDDGGECAFLLLVEKVGNTYEKAPDGTPKYPFFQLSTKAAPTFQDKLKALPFSLTPEPWQISED